MSGSDYNSHFCPVGFIILFVVRGIDLSSLQIFVDFSLFKFGIASRREFMNTPMAQTQIAYIRCLHINSCLQDRLNKQTGNISM